MAACNCNVRFLIGAMIVYSTFVVYMLRVDIAITLVDMVLPEKAGGKVIVGECIEQENKDKRNETKEPEPKVDLTGRLDWSKDQQGLFLSLYYVGSIILSFPGGILSERFGPTLCTAVTSILAGVLTAVTPPMTALPFPVTVINRFIVGLCSGVTYPAAQVLIARWVAPNEKGIFTALMMSGGTLATVVTWPLLGFIVAEYKWPWGFYVPAMITAVWAILWCTFVRDFPHKHYMSRQRELDYLQEAQGGSVSKKKYKVPYKQIFLSVPVWAYVTAQFGNLWGLLMWASILPTFEAEALGFKIAKAGLIGMLPNLLRMIAGFVFGGIGDYLVKSGKFKKKTVRKFFLLFSHFLPGAFLVVVTFLGCHKYLIVACITVSMMLNGSICVSHLQNPQDISPNYAGTVYGIGNSIGGITGLVTPPLALAITKGSGKLFRWYIVFWISAGIYVFTGLIFLFFGSTDVQPWNSPTEEEAAKQDAEAAEKQAAKDAKKAEKEAKKAEKMAAKEAKMAEKERQKAA